MNQIVVAIHFTMIGSEQDDGPVRFSSGFNFLENLADLIVDQCYFSRVIGPQLSRVVDLFVGGFREFSIEFAGGAVPDASLLKAQLRFGPGRAWSHQSSETRAETSTLAAYSAPWSEAWRCQPFARPRAKPAGRCHARANAPNSHPSVAATKSTPF